MQCGLGASSQANRLRASCRVVYRDKGGRGDWIENSRSAATLSSLFALQWFSHQTCLLNQGPHSTKTANCVPMSCPPFCPFSVPTQVLSFSTLFYLPSNSFLSCCVRLIFPGFCQVGKHCVGSLAFPRCLSNSH